jgi:hypothetical protein
MPMHNLATKLLKKWLGMNIPANPAILSLPREHHGLDIPSIIDKESYANYQITSCAKFF